ncbi:MAG TPA: acyl carrier protein [Candidatus Ornithocaccomicrobium faecavium]|uniref:Acyl carrier protein n=1 Tax=Candidatus Ornithocaccomicrobium faecavium TaxID=2840890 RepID=A0A9D1P781_9FIRM|nr:acyl carrier protein [Clostridiales bacterium]HIV27888.1 acyl carrier protein [Candidatus Ornithocaccomicrobium faecavium]
MDTFNKVAQMLADHKGIDVNTITMDSTFAELQVDSLDVAELVMNFEDEFGISIELDEAVKTVADMVKRIEEAKAAQ